METETHKPFEETKGRTSNPHLLHTTVADYSTKPASHSTNYEKPNGPVNPNHKVDDSEIRDNNKPAANEVKPREHAEDYYQGKPIRVEQPNNNNTIHNDQAKPRNEAPRNEQPRYEAPRNEQAQPRNEQPRNNQSQPRNDVPRNTEQSKPRTEKPRFAQSSPVFSEPRSNSPSLSPASGSNNGGSVRSNSSSGTPSNSSGGGRRK